LFSMLFASFLISRYEGPKNPRPNANNNGGTQSGGGLASKKEGNPGILYQDEVWRPCLKGIHPAWLLAFRVCAFLVLLILLIINAIVDGASIFYYYTQ